MQCNLPWPILLETWYTWPTLSKQKLLTLTDTTMKSSHIRPTLPDSVQLTLTNTGISCLHCTTTASVTFNNYHQNWYRFIQWWLPTFSNTTTSSPTCNSKSVSLFPLNAVTTRTFCSALAIFCFAFFFSFILLFRTRSRWTRKLCCQCNLLLSDPQRAVSFAEFSNHSLMWSAFESLSKTQLRLSGRR